ncbi:LamG domain-containing protein [Candidatus Poribacteria bacterium]|nr:LamG domain-containing protein [Candidatus Poribacteria bacterium]
MVKYRFVFFLSVLLMFVAVISYAAKDEATLEGEWNFDNGDAADSSGKGLDGNIVGDPEVVDGIVGTALLFDGVDDGVKLPDSVGINTLAQPNFYTDRTIAAYFNCTDVYVTEQKQTIFEEGGRTRGLVINVFDGQVYVAGWNRAEYQWQGAFPSASVESGVWYHVGLVIRDATNAVEAGKFEMWLNGELIASEDGGALFGHGDDIGIAHVNANAVFHDEDGAGTNIHYFGGIIDEVVVYNSAFDAADFAEYATPVVSVEPQDKFTTTWASIKAERTRQ